MSIYYVNKAYVSETSKALFKEAEKCNECLINRFHHKDVIKDVILFQLFLKANERQTFV